MITRSPSAVPTRRPKDAESSVVSRRRRALARATTRSRSAPRRAAIAECSSAHRTNCRFVWPCTLHGASPQPRGVGCCPQGLSCLQAGRSRGTQWLGSTPSPRSPAHRCGSSASRPSWQIVHWASGRTRPCRRAGRPVVEQVAAVPLVNARPETHGSIGVAVEVLHHLPGKPGRSPRDRRPTRSPSNRPGPRSWSCSRGAVPGVMSVLRRPVDERIVRHERALKQMARRHGRDRRRRAHAAVEHLNVRRVQALA